MRKFITFLGLMFLWVGIGYAGQYFDTEVDTVNAKCTVRIAGDFRVGNSTTNYNFSIDTAGVLGKDLNMGNKNIYGFASSSGTELTITYIYFPDGSVMGSTEAVGIPYTVLNATYNALALEDTTFFKTDGSRYCTGIASFTKTGDWSIAASSGIIINGETSGGAGIEFGNTGGDTHKIWYNPTSGLIECDAYFKLTRRQLQVPEGQGVDFNGDGSAKILKWESPNSRFEFNDDIYTSGEAYFTGISTHAGGIYSDGIIAINYSTMDFVNVNYNIAVSSLGLVYLDYPNNTKYIRWNYYDNYFLFNDTIATTGNINLYSDRYINFNYAGDGKTLLHNGTQFVFNDNVYIPNVAVDTTTSYNIFKATATYLYNRDSNHDSHFKVLDDSGT